MRIIKWFKRLFKKKSANSEPDPKVVEAAFREIHAINEQIRRMLER